MKTYRSLSCTTIFVACLFQNLLLFSYLFLTCDSEQKLVLVNVVFRHGDRAPDREIGETYPNDPNVNASFFPMGSGGMTNEGKRRSYQLGKVLREKYSDFLGPIYLSENIKAQSTDSQRTIMTLQLVLASLYPPESVQKWNPDLNWQPIPFIYEKKARDWLLWPTNCPKYKQEYEKVLKSSEILKRIEKFQPLMDRLTKLTGKEIKSMRDVLILYSTLDCENSMNLTIPEWGKEYLNNGQLSAVGNFQVELRNYNKMLKKLNGGVLVRKMIDDMIAAKNGTLEKGRKIIMYSAHDLNLGGQILTLGIAEPHIPKYTSSVILELYKNNEAYFVQVLYYLGVPSEMKIMKIPGCEEMCPFEKFISLLKDVMPDDNEFKCQA
ncbi:venom acid phosphatase Acph-1-like [Leptopilina boulardi]|uniref:venom acid phosphatase Acph-1-like n=1 Tax=Leptopilina boulardi TaxID=63433 RepID=UPI0021F6737C|nr:venom acid phosphatase Acph-1-like [Leptopilina boulardi]